MQNGFKRVVSVALLIGITERIGILIPQGARGVARGQGVSAASEIPDTDLHPKR